MVERGDLIAGAYTIREELEADVLFEARDTLLDRVVVVKLARRDQPSMILEARRCAAVHAPCAVAIYGMGHHDGLEYVVGERVTGARLCELLGKSDEGRARSTAGSGAKVDAPLAPARYLELLRGVIHAVARAHEAGVTVGDISGATTLIARPGSAAARGEADAERRSIADGRIVLGRLSLSQVPAFGPLGQILAPEVVRGEVDAADPAAAVAIDLYGLGCIALELASGAPPFSGGDHATELRGHAHAPPPRLGDVRADLPADLSDLVEWLLAKQPRARPPSAQEALAQLDAILAREDQHTRALRVLVVEHDAARARWLGSLVRRAYASAIVDTASEGTDAAHKLSRDHPELVFVDAQLRGVMNALELCMYARGLETEHATQLVIVGTISDRDRSLLSDTSISVISDDVSLGATLVERVRRAASTPSRRRRPRKTISG